MSDEDNIPVAQTDAAHEAWIKAIEHRMVAYLAQNISFSLFSPERKDDLCRQVVHLVDSRLNDERIEMPSEDRVKLIKHILAHISTASNSNKEEQTAKAEDSATAWDFEKLRTHIAPHLAANLSNQDIAQDNKSRLAIKVSKLVANKIQVDSLPVTAELFEKLLNGYCQAMGTQIPEGWREFLPAENSPPPVLDEKKHPGKPTETALTKDNTKKSDALTPEQLSINLRPPNPEEWRDFVLTLGASLEPAIMGDADDASRRDHVRKKANSILGERHIHLLPSQVEDLVDSIVSGSGFQFNL